jgi:hypothetical protein
MKIKIFIGCITVLIILFLGYTFIHARVILSIEALFIYSITVLFIGLGIGIVIGMSLK